MQHSFANALLLRQIVLTSRGESLASLTQWRNLHTECTAAEAGSEQPDASATPEDKPKRPRRRRRRRKPRTEPAPADA